MHFELNLAPSKRFIKNSIQNIWINRDQVGKTRHQGDTGLSFFDLLPWPHCLMPIIRLHELVDGKDGRYSDFPRSAVTRSVRSGTTPGFITTALDICPVVPGTRSASDGIIQSCSQTVRTPEDIDLPKL